MMKKKKKILWAGAAIVLLLLVLAAIFTALPREKEELTYHMFLEHLENDEIEQVYLREEDVYFRASLKEDPARIYQVLHPQTDHFVEDLLLRNITVSYENTAALPWYIQAAVVLVLLGLFGWNFFRNRNASQFQAEAETADLLYSLADVAGNEESKHMVDDLISFIRTPEKYARLGARMPRGILFFGPPGTGKTLMAKAVAGEAGVPFFAMSGSDFVQTYVGVGAGRIRDLFKKARKAKKAVIFIDEIDALGKKRGNSLSASNDERDQTLNALLTEMSGFHDRDGIVVIAATNRIDTLDEALLRPGRFDRQIEIGLPDYPARLKILALHCKDKPLSDEIDLENLAKTTISFSGAMLENLVNEAAITAANNGAAAIGRAHMERAFYTVIAGVPKSDYSQISAEDRRITACHESGHALMTRLLLPEHTISKVTIIPSTSGAGGFSLSIPKESSFMKKHEIESQLMVLLAGRAAEELVSGLEDITTGASDDIRKATSLLLSYISRYGMDEEFGIFYADENDAQVHELARKKMLALYGETKKILLEHRQLLEYFTLALLEKETLNQSDIDQLMAAA